MSTDKNAPPYRSNAVSAVLIVLFVSAAVLFFLNPQLPVNIAVALFLGVFLFVAAFFNTDFALAVLIFSMLLSPNIDVGAIPQRSVMLRLEDLLLVIIFLGWMAKVSLRKDFALMRTTPLSVPIVAYTVITVAATLAGVLESRLSLKISSFYLLKYFEYFLLFFLVTNHVRDVEGAKRFTLFLFLTCCVVTLYGWTQIPSGERVSTPFQGEGGEPNTLGGYFILMMAMTIGFIIHHRALRGWMVALLIAMFVPFLMTLSRGSWVAFVPMFGAFILFSRRHRAALCVAALVMSSMVVVMPFLMPRQVHTRVRESFSGGNTYSLMGARVTFDESTSARIETWREAWQKLQQKPVWGFGAPGAAVIDNQYTRILIETGLLGIVCFVWLALTLLRVSWYSYVAIPDDFAQSLSLGFIAGLTGLLAHSFSAATFILIRIMEPFWFFAAIVVMLPHLYGALPEEGRA